MFNEKIRGLELADVRLDNLKKDLSIEGEGIYTDAGFVAAYGGALDAVISLQDAEIIRLDAAIREIRKV